MTTPRLNDAGALRSFYDERYEGAYMEAHASRELERVRDLLGYVPAGSISRVLDYGCGRAVWFPLLLELFPDAAVAGAEISPKALALARTRFPDLELREFDGVRAPFDDGSFELVFSYHVLEHVLDLGATLGDMTRLVAPGGYLALVLPCGDAGSLEERLVRLSRATERSSTGELRFAYEDPAHLRRVDSETLIAHVACDGLTPCESLFANHLWGGVELLLGSRPEVIRALLDPRRADRVADRVALTLLRAALLSGRTLARVYHLSDPRRRRRRRAAKLLHPLALAARPLLSLPFGALDALVSREWRTRRHARGGSAQYLLFRRPTASGPSA